MNRLFARNPSSEGAMSMRVLVLICFAMSLFSVPAAGVTPELSNLEDAQAIQKLLADFTGAWNRHDMRAFSELFTNDADFVVISGKHLKGRAEIFTYHDGLHKGAFKNRQQSSKWNDLRFIRPDVAIGHVAFEATSTSGDQALKRTALATVVLTKKGGRWLITALQNTLLSGPPPGAVSSRRKMMKNYISIG
jgi:uncharacterized protein (TIGR02246 family)